MRKRNARYKCWQCRSNNVFVVKTLILGNGIVKRRRRCRECGHVMNTREAPELPRKKVSFSELQREAMERRGRQ